MIYLDHNATTPPAPGVVQAMLAAMTDVWANASSQHLPGQQAKRALAAARAANVRPSRRNAAANCAAPGRDLRAVWPKRMAGSRSAI